VTKWVLRCTRCGGERTLDVAFDLASMGSRIHLYCRSCRSNTEHLVAGYWDEGVFVTFEEAVRERFRSLQ
jgi:hypothetical protein